MPYQGGRLNSRAAINQIKLESLPYFVFSGNADIIPYGEDNLYPFRVMSAISKSPTALGCVKRQSEFIMGNGLADGKGDIIVNRDGDTLNDIVNQCIRFGYSQYYGYGVHCNFNSLGQICEMFFVNLEYIRKHRTLNKAEYGIWREQGNYFTDFHNITVDLYDRKTVFSKMREVGTKDYKGQLHYYSKDKEIYPTSPLDSALISASYEKEAQIYPYANIKNGFSGNTIIKYPTLSMGEEAEEEAKEVQENLQKLHGADRAGSSLVVPVSVNKDGEPKEFKMVEHLSPTNVDTLFLNQNGKAENDILKVYNMPKILLGISDQGMFNAASFNDAFDYKNSDTEFDRKEIERDFNKLLKHSVWAMDIEGGINFVPFQMKGENNSIVVPAAPEQEGTESTTTLNTVSPEQLKAQANLKGSVGGVQGIIQIQQSVSQGLSTTESALSVLELIYGFTNEDARRLLGNPEKTKQDAGQTNF